MGIVFQIQEESGENAMDGFKITPYLYLPGTSEQAMNFYKNALGGEIVFIQRYKETPDFPGSEENGEKIIHGQLKVGDQSIYFSDVLDENEVTFGGQISLTLEHTEVEAIEKAYRALSEGGKVHLPLQETFWGAKYAKLTDPFGVNWDLNCQLND